MERIIADSKFWWLPLILPISLAFSPLVRFVLLLIGFAFVLRLVQWHLWRRLPEFPPANHQLTREYNAARSRLWIASLVPLVLAVATLASILVAAPGETP